MWHPYPQWKHFHWQDALTHGSILLDKESGVTEDPEERGNCPEIKKNHDGWNGQNVVSLIEKREITDWKVHYTPQWKEAKNYRAWRLER